MPPVDGRSSELPGARLYRSGPWLVIYGKGTDSENAALRIREQCIARGIDSALRPIDEIAQVRLDRFAGLVVVLPWQLDVSPPAELQSFARLIMDYRARRPEGLDAILNGSCEWFDAGVVQVVGRRAIMHHLAMRTALDRVCARHYTDGPTSLDVFKPYTTQSSVLEEQPAGDVHDESIERLWRDIRAWGVSDIRTVPELRKCIDNCRNYYENKRFYQLHRPINDLPRNRPGVILDGLYNIATGDHKKWMENGTRVWRYVEKELKKIEPRLSRPDGRNNTKDAQKELRRLYRNLRIIENWMRSQGKGGPLLPNS